MWVSKDDDGTLALHEEFPRLIVVDGYKSYHSPNMIILSKVNIFVGDGPMEVELKIK